MSFELTQGTMGSVWMEPRSRSGLHESRIFPRAVSSRASSQQRPQISPAPGPPAPVAAHSEVALHDLRRHVQVRTQSVGAKLLPILSSATGHRAGPVQQVIVLMGFAQKECWSGENAASEKHRREGPPSGWNRRPEVVPARFRYQLCRSTVEGASPGTRARTPELPRWRPTRQETNAAH